MSDDTAVEYGGVLVGTADPLIGLVIVMAHEPLPDSDSAETVTFTRETWDHMTRVVMARHPGQRIVGWYHSHPRFGIFLSAHDVAIQTTYFSQPWQVSYVFDPVQHERGLFGWSNYEIVRIHEWEVATAVNGIETSAPAHVPAHGQYITTRLAEEAALASLASAELASNPAAAVASPPAFAAPVPGAQQVGAAPARAPGRSPRPRRPVWIALLAAALLVGAVAAFFIGRDNGTSSTSPTTVGTSVSTAPPAATMAAATTVVASTGVAITSTSAATADTVTESSPPATADTSTTSIGVAGSALPTPATVTAPGARVAAGTAPCVAAADGAYTPTANCFVPLNNGNIVSYVGGSLECVDPAGTLLAPATSFTVGATGDPLVIIADGTLVPKCGDLTYAKNVLAGGASTLDGLCGSSATAIDDASLRCFAQNASTGAMAALVGGPSGSIAGSCSNGAGAPAATPLVWTKGNVDVSWRIVSLVYDAATQAFTASATRNGVPTTATFGCA